MCCPPGSAAQRKALETELIKDSIVSEADAPAVAAWVLKHFDLAPAGTLQPFTGAIAEMVRHTAR